jgi:hypothetical protein
MSEPIRLKTFQIGTPVKRGEGLRIAVTMSQPHTISGKNRRICSS